MKAQGLLLPVAGASMETAVTSMALDVRYVDNVAVQFNFIGTPTGNFYVDASVDQSNWTPFNFNPAPAAGGFSGTVLINMAGVAAPYLRFRYVPVSGSGSLDVWVNTKSTGS